MMAKPEFSFKYNFNNHEIVAIEKIEKSKSTTLYGVFNAIKSSTAESVFNKIQNSGIVKYKKDVIFINGNLVDFRQAFRDMIKCYISYNENIVLNIDEYFSYDRNFIVEKFTKTSCYISIFFVNDPEIAEGIICGHEITGKIVVAAEENVFNIDGNIYTENYITSILKEKGYIKEGLCGALIYDSHVTIGKIFRYPKHIFTPRFIADVLLFADPNATHPRILPVSKTIPVKSTPQVESDKEIACTQNCHGGFDIITYIDGSFKIDIPNFKNSGKIGILRSLTDEKIDVVADTSETLSIGFNAIMYGFYVTPSVYMINCGFPLYIVSNQKHWESLLGEIHKRTSPFLPDQILSHTQI